MLFTLFLGFFAIKASCGQFLAFRFLQDVCLRFRSLQELFIAQAIFFLLFLCRLLLLQQPDPCFLMLLLENLHLSFSLIEHQILAPSIATLVTGQEQCFFLKHLKKFKNGLLVTGPFLHLRHLLRLLRRREHDLCLRLLLLRSRFIPQLLRLLLQLLLRLLCLLRPQESCGSFELCLESSTFRLFELSLESMTFRRFERLESVRFSPEDLLAFRCRLVLRLLLRERHRFDEDDLQEPSDKAASISKRSFRSDSDMTMGH